ncbi:MAG: acyl dehydratase [Cyclobacteriaceae bacterium]|jgi:acyl dehydratase
MGSIYYFWRSFNLNNMSAIVVRSFEDFNQYLGQSLGQSTSHKVTQSQIDKFADATLDHQWIHIDHERAKQGPFGMTIAHGYLTLSMVPHMWEQILQAENLKMMVNYGIDKLKFGQHVPVGSEIVLKAKLENLTNLRGVIKAEVGARMEIVGSPKPVFTATLVLLYHFHE